MIAQGVLKVAEPVVRPEKSTEANHKFNHASFLSPLDGVFALSLFIAGLVKINT